MFYQTKTRRSISEDKDDEDFVPSASRKRLLLYCVLVYVLYSMDILLGGRSQGSWGREESGFRRKGGVKVRRLICLGTMYLCFVGWVNG